MEKEPTKPIDVLANAEQAYVEIRQEFTYLWSDIELLSEELHTFEQTHAIRDPEAQQLYRTLKEEMDALIQRGHAVVELKHLDEAEFKTILAQTLKAYRSYEHMLLVGQKYLSGQPQSEMSRELEAVQTTIRRLEDKRLHYGFDDELPDDE